MDKLSIVLNEDKTAFAPGQTVQGTIQWRRDDNPQSLALSLFWYTCGKGTRDVGVVETRRFDNPGSFGSRDFTFALPAGPYSFSGKLISLLWALELTCTPGCETVRREIVLSPTGREIVLGDGPADRDSPSNETGSRHGPLQRILGLRT